MKPATNRLAGRVVELLRGSRLLQLALSHHCHPLAERHRLDLIVRDVDGRHADLLVEEPDLGPHLRPQLCVEVREWLVHEEHPRLSDDRSTHRHSLPLASGQLAAAALQLLLQLEDDRRHPP